MIDLEAIRGRHQHEESRDEWPQDINHARSLLGMAHKDRAALLAEVDRLKGLCGRAAEAVRAYHIEDYPDDQPTPDKLEAELREAAK